MKSILKIFVGSFLFLLFFTYTSEARNRKNKDKEFKETLEFLEKGEFQFEADRCYSSMFPSVDLFGNHNHLRILGDTVNAFLPYFGEAYNIGYTNDRGIVFEGKIQDLNKTIIKKKRMIRYKFSIKKSTDFFECVLEIGGSRFASLTVISQKRRSIRYSGQISEIKEDSSH